MFKLITLLFTSSMTVMAGATIAPALPEIQQFFQATPNFEFLVRLMLTIPALFTAIAAPVAGIIIDRFGRKPLLTISVILYGIAGGSGCVLNSLYGLLIGRALLGIAVAGVTTTSIALIADYYQGAKRNQIMGIQAAFMGFGGVLFLTLGGLLADISWRFPFLIYLTAFGVLPLVIFVLSEPENPINNVQKSGENETEINIDKQLKITIIFIYILMFLTMVAFYMVPVQIPFYLQKSYQVSSSQTGMAIACATLASSIISLSYGRVKTIFSFPGVLMLLYLFMGIGYMTVSRAMSYPIVIFGLVISGLGLGLLLPNMNVWLNAKTPITIRGKVLGGLTTCMFLGQFSSPILIQPLISQFGIGNSYGIVGLIMLIFAAILIGGSFTGKYSVKAN